MKQTINFYDFQKAFQDLRPNNFTYDGLRALFEYLEDLEDKEACELMLAGATLIVLAAILAASTL